MGSPRHEDMEDLLLGRSTQMERVRQLAARAAAVDVPVLITGETGTGKSLVARLIHLSGDRRSVPLVPINCSGIPDGLFESEFFGHRRGAFTGAVESRRGLFELANGGTLFMDEVAELPTHQQAKLLTVLEDHEVRRVGDERTRPLDVRILSATLPRSHRGRAVRAVPSRPLPPDRRSTNRHPTPQGATRRRSAARRPDPARSRTQVCEA